VPSCLSLVWLRKLARLGIEQEPNTHPYTGPDWLLLLLIIGRMPSPSANLASVLILLCRTWTLHNNITHRSGPTSILESIHFLLNYQHLLTGIRQQCDDRIGKESTVRSWIGTGSQVRTPCRQDNSVGQRRQRVAQKCTNQ
jgi:hypothetical protein